MKCWGWTNDYRPCPQKVMYAVSVIWQGNRGSPTYQFYTCEDHVKEDSGYDPTIRNRRL